MIAEIRFKNMFSFRDEAILSFEADKSKDMESYHVVELGGGGGCETIESGCHLWSKCFG